MDQLSLKFQRPCSRIKNHFKRPDFRSPEMFDELIFRSNCSIERGDPTDELELAIHAVQCLLRRQSLSRPNRSSGGIVHSSKGRNCPEGCNFGYREFMKLFFSLLARKRGKERKWRINLRSSTIWRATRKRMIHAPFNYGRSRYFMASADKS